jgi:death-on-curing protein
MEPIWLSTELVQAMHLRQLSEHGGGAGVRDLGLLDSALQRPLNRAANGEVELAGLAADFAFGIARNHPFIDGNKRTALVASFTFLYLNGWVMNSSQIENVQTFLSLAASTLSEDQLAGWFKQNMRNV